MNTSQPFEESATITSPGTPTRANVLSNNNKGPRFKYTPPRSKKRCNWEDGETFELISAWGPRVEKFKGASNKQKKFLWDAIYTTYKENVREPKEIEQVKTKLKNLENDYKKAKARIGHTGEEGANKIKEEVEFFDEIDEFLGHRDAVDVENMTLESSMGLFPLQTFTV